MEQEAEVDAGAPLRGGQVRVLGASFGIGIEEPFQDLFRVLRYGPRPGYLAGVDVVEDLELGPEER